MTDGRTVAGKEGTGEARERGLEVADGGDVFYSLFVREVKGRGLRHFSGAIGGVICPGGLAFAVSFH